MNSNISTAGNKLWCPYCQNYENFLKTHKAAVLADVTRRTIYCYIEEGKIYAVKVAGNTYRVCSSCLFKSEKVWTGMWQNNDIDSASKYFALNFSETSKTR